MSQSVSQKNYISTYTLTRSPAEEGINAAFRDGPKVKFLLHVLSTLHSSSTRILSVMYLHPSGQLPNTVLASH